MLVRQGGRGREVRTVDFDRHRNEVILIEQRLLPHRFSRVRMRDHRETARAITDMVVRGAGAIGATAAFGLAQGAQEFRGRGMGRFLAHLDRVASVLARARPTAVDPLNALAAVRAAVGSASTPAEGRERAIAAAAAFADANVAECRAVGDLGVPLIREGMRVLTHCNAGWLAFVDMGTATAPLYAAHARGIRFHVWCDETRPRSQGATLTALELSQQGISHAVIADNAAGHLMQRGLVDLVITGSDRVIARTGEVANKIGTYTKAVLARRHGIQFYVAVPWSTLDWEMESGADIPIEERAEEEVLGAWGVDASGRRRHVRVANPESPAFNPGFDVTPPDLVTGVITPAGIFRPRELWRRRRLLLSHAVPVAYA